MDHHPAFRPDTQDEFYPVPNTYQDTIMKPPTDAVNTPSVLTQYGLHQVPDPYRDGTSGHYNQSPLPLLPQMESDQVLQPISDALAQDIPQGNQPFPSYEEMYRAIQVSPHQQTPQDTTLRATYTPTQRMSPHDQPTLLPGGTHTPTLAVSPSHRPSPSPEGTLTSIQGLSLQDRLALPGGTHTPTQGVSTALASPSYHPSPLKQKGGRRGRRSAQPKPLKLYERERFEDPVQEKKRRDAINSRENRLRKAAHTETLKQMLDEYAAQRSELQQDIQALMQQETVLRKQIAEMIAVRHGSTTQRNP